MVDKDFETRSKGGKARWKGVSKKDRTAYARKIGKLRWKKKNVLNMAKG